MTLHNITNDELLNEIKKRFDDRDTIIKDSKFMMKKLEEMNKKLTNAEENRSKFMSIIKNEFNNPLFSMISLSKSLLKSSQDEKTQMIGNSLYEESLMLNFQIKNIINAAEIESGTMDLQLSKINFTDIILQIKEELQYPIKSKNINLELNILQNNENYFDREKIYLILLNLISNSVEFSPKDSTVIIDILEEIEDIKIIVKDFGEGIDEKQLENIFKRFYQAHSGMNRIHRGQGLGLSIVKDVVDFLDGNIQLESKINEFTLFEITLPKHNSDADALFDDDDFMFDLNESEEF